MTGPKARGKNTLDRRARYWAPPVSLPPRAMRLRRAWVAALHARDVMHSQIVSAFRLDIKGAGPGPTDVDLRLVARVRGRRGTPEAWLSRSQGRCTRAPPLN